jgi:hypothetical protein
MPGRTTLAAKPGREALQSCPGVTEKFRTLVENSSVEVTWLLLVGHSQLPR